VTHDAYGELYWLTSGPRALTPKQVVDICVRFGLGRGLPARNIPTIDSRGLELDTLGLASPQVAALRTLVDSAETIEACGGILASSVDDLAERFDVVVPDIALAYERTLAYWSTDAKVAR
jgi:hypothetical protein